MHSKTKAFAEKFCINTHCFPIQNDTLLVVLNGGGSLKLGYMIKANLRNDAMALSEGICQVKNVEKRNKEHVFRFCLAYVCIFAELLERGQEIGLSKNLASLHYGKSLDSGKYVSVRLEGFSDKAKFYYPEGFSSSEKLFFKFFIGSAKEILVRTSIIDLEESNADSELRCALREVLKGWGEGYIRNIPLSIFEGLERTLSLHSDESFLYYKRSVLFNPPRSMFDEESIMRIKSLGMVLGEPHGGNYCYYINPTPREVFESEVCDYYSSPKNKLWPNIRASKNKIKYYLTTVRNYFAFRRYIVDGSAIFVLPLLSYNDEVLDCKKLNIILSKIKKQPYKNIALRFHPYEKKDSITFAVNFFKKSGVKATIDDSSYPLLKKNRHFERIFFLDCRTTASAELCYSGKCYAHVGLYGSINEFSHDFLKSFFVDFKEADEVPMSGCDEWLKIRKEFSNDFYRSSFFYLLKFAFFVRFRRPVL